MGPVALLVVSSEDDGGAARSVWLLARDLSAAGVRAPVALHRRGSLAARLAAAGLPYEIVPDLLEHPFRRGNGRQAWGALPANILALPRAVRQLRALARRYGASILYGHGTWANYQAAFAARGAALASVWHVRNDHSHGATRRVGRLVARLTRPAAIIAVSAAAGRPYEGLPARLEIVHNGADILASDRAREAPLLRQRLGIDRSRVVAGYAGRLVPHKGLDCLMEAARLALARVPTLDLVILGGDPRHVGRSVLGDLRAQVGDWGLAGRIHLPGRVEDVERWLADMDVVLVPSTFRDPCPRVVLESLALGIPIIASRVGGIPEIVRDGVDGILVSAGSPCEIADALAKLSLDRSTSRAMGLAAREAARTRFDSRTVALRVAGILEGVAGAGKPVER